MNRELLVNCGLLSLMSLHCRLILDSAFGKSLGKLDGA